MKQQTITVPALKITEDTFLPHVVRPLKMRYAKAKALIEDLTKKGYGHDNEICLLTTLKDGSVAPYGVIGKILNITSVKATYYQFQVLTQERVVVLSHTNDDGPTFAEVAISPFTGDISDNEIAQLKADIAKIFSKDETIPGMDKDIPKVLSFLSFREGFLTKEQRVEILLNGTFPYYIEKIQGALSHRLLQIEVIQTTEKDVQKNTRTMQKDAIIRQQIKALQSQLSDAGDDDTEELEERISKADVPDDVRKELNKQAKRIRQMQPTSSEYPVTMNYIETLLGLPWTKGTEAPPIDLTKAAEVLNEHHHGMQKTKKRILEYLAVCALKPDLTPPLLCLVGPPGTGKSTIAKSIAESLGRKFDRISLGGVSDENEMRGHRRTYVGAMPGRFVKTLLKVGVNNPVILLDEIDKMGRDFRGDPAAALLEILDPDQNASFVDHYVDVPVDLSKCVFIATANDLGPIPAPLKDRMEVIEIPSYTLHEKLEIAENHLFPRMAEQHGILPLQVSFERPVLEHLITSYTLEAGVRTLGKRVADICRHVALKVATDPHTIFEVTQESLFEILGPERYDHDKIRSEDSVGVVTGLAWTPFGGDILSIEASFLRGKGDLKITGNLGDVMKESVQAAWSVLRKYDKFAPVEKDVHLHVPAGATPKDGPSAGVTIATAILSAYLKHAIPRDVAMSGEITISGDVLPVGGIREKVIAAHRAGIKRVFLPNACKRDLHDIPENVLKDIKITFVKRYEEIVKELFGDSLESRLNW